MTFDPAVFLVLFNPLTVLSVSVLGAFIGRFLVRRFAVFPAHVIDFLITVGTAWTVLLLVIRFAQGSSAWEAYVAAVVLWWVLCIAIALGYRWRR